MYQEKLSAYRGTIDKEKSLFDKQNFRDRKKLDVSRISTRIFGLLKYQLVLMVYDEPFKYSS